MSDVGHRGSAREFSISLTVCELRVIFFVSSQYVNLVGSFPVIMHFTIVLRHCFSVVLCVFFSFAVIPPWKRELVVGNVRNRIGNLCKNIIFSAVYCPSLKHGSSQMQINWESPPQFEDLIKGSGVCKEHYP